MIGTQSGAQPGRSVVEARRVGILHGVGEVEVVHATDRDYVQVHVGHAVRPGDGFAEGC